MKLTFVISSMEAGGAERVLSILANHWADKGWNITILTFTNSPSFFDLHSSINYHSLDILERSPLAVQRVLDNFKRLWVLRKAIQKSEPQVVISFLTDINVHTLVSTLGLGLPVIVSERSEPGKHFHGAIWDKLGRWTYPLADKVVSVTESADHYFEWLPKDKRCIIPNPIISRSSNAEDGELPKGIDPEKKWLVAMGRLTQVKGYDLLLTAFQKIAVKYDDWQLIILGEGNLRLELANLRRTLGLENQVILPGLLKNPFPLLNKSQLFVLSSRYEGFVNSLGEAMACGLPAVSFDCPGGPREIIRHEIDGILVAPEDVPALAEALDRLMGNEMERKRLAAKAVEVVKRFSKDKTMEMWEEVILDATSSNRAAEISPMKRI